MGESSKAKEIFVKISKTEAIFEEKNKHFFNECAIQLRKQKLYDEAIDYYHKGIELSPNDENLYFNSARAHFEKGDHEKAKESIFKVISINPAHKEAKAFLNYMDQKRNVKSEEK
jgi:tetratricopeptide (TPR) repeat protein